MIAVDTQILVYFQRKDSPWHQAALACVRGLAEGPTPWAVPWPSVHEFLAVVTHPRIYRPPTPLEQALRQIDYWMASPTVRMIGEEAGYWERFKRVLTEGRVAGPLVHDGRVAAICAAHGVTELWSVDRDFSRFPTLRTRNPLSAKL